VQGLGDAERFANHFLLIWSRLLMSLYPNRIEDLFFLIKDSGPPRDISSPPAFDFEAQLS
jgi:hypothetical protein